MSPTYTTPPPVQPSNDTGSTSTSAILAASQKHPNGHLQSSMDGRQNDYPQSALNSPYAHYPGPPSTTQSEAHSASAAAAHQQHQHQQYPANVKFEQHPDSVRPGNYPGYLQQQQQQQQQPQGPPPQSQQRPYTNGASRASYPQQNAHQHGGHHSAASSTSSSMAQTTSRSNHAPREHNHSDATVPIDPSIAASSPTYPSHQQYSPYPPQHEMQQYAGQPQAPMYAQPRPEWAGHYGPPMYGHAPVSAAGGGGPQQQQQQQQQGGGGPGMVAQVARPPPVYAYQGGQPPGYSADPYRQGGHPISTVYSFVPIPGAQQHKRPRRRYEEIERMYKCGWNGCEKAYGTLNHLNAHVTMQSHGTKRTPEEFKEIRKEWKAKKKEEETQRKQEEDRHRVEGGTPNPAAGQYPPAHMMPPNMGGPQLPPIGYAPAGGQAPPQYAGAQGPVDGAQQYAAQGQMYGGAGYPQSPYAQSNQIYQQHPEQQQGQSYQPQ